MMDSTLTHLQTIGSGVGCGSVGDDIGRIDYGYGEAVVGDIYYGVEGDTGFGYDIDDPQWCEYVSIMRDVHFTNKCPTIILSYMIQKAKEYGLS